MPLLKVKLLLDLFLAILDLFQGPTALHLFEQQQK